ncbi:hypothetical protein FSP39_006343 [Pinctada imbricata]|uniref:Uncharacterized protein n=1 Tax=Pinctada imbricata TaxID=66713 RepID=A0AA88Y1I2_PINIB|nr:hypothetical protein FSP39_006343 [Pinctada imbricata]
MQTTKSHQFITIDDIANGKCIGYAHSLAKLTDRCKNAKNKNLRHAVYFEEALKRIIRQCEQTIKDVTQNDRVISEFTIGKSFANSKKSTFFANDPTTWKLSGGFTARWQQYKNAKYHGLVVLACIDSKTIHERYKRKDKIVDCQLFTLALEQSLIKHYLFVDPNENLANESLDCGSKWKKENEPDDKESKNGVIYIAFRFEDDHDSNSQQNQNQTRSESSEEDKGTIKKDNNYSKNTTSSSSNSNVLLKDITDEESDENINNEYIESSEEGILTRDAYLLPGERCNITNQTSEEKNSLLKKTSLMRTLPKETSPRETLPRETLPRDALPRETLPRDTLPRDTLPRETSEKDTSVKQSSAKETSAMETFPKETSVMETFPKDSSVMESLPKETSAMETFPKDSSVMESFPKETSAMETFPKDSSVMESFPKETSAMETFPKATSAMETFPKETSAMETFPKETSAMETFPKETSAMETFPKETSAMETFPKETSAMEKFPKETSAMETFPKETSAMETFPKETSANETFQKETSAMETFQRETSAMETFPKETSAMETFPKDSSVMESLSKETSAMETFPKETSVMKSLSKETSAMETFQKDSSVMESLSKETSAMETLPKETSVIETITRETSAKMTSAKETFVKETSTKESSTMEVLTKDTIAKESTTKETMSRETLSKDISENRKISKTTDVMVQRRYERENVKEQQNYIETADHNSPNKESQNVRELTNIAQPSKSFSEMQTPNYGIVYSYIKDKAESATKPSLQKYHRTTVPSYRTKEQIQTKSDECCICGYGKGRSKRCSICEKSYHLECYVPKLESIPVQSDASGSHKQSSVRHTRSVSSEQGISTNSIKGMHSDFDIFTCKLNDLRSKLEARHLNQFKTLNEFIDELDEVFLIPYEETSRSFINQLQEEKDNLKKKLFPVSQQHPTSSSGHKRKIDTLPGTKNSKKSRHKLCQENEMSQLGSEEKDVVILISSDEDSNDNK